MVWVVAIVEAPEQNVRIGVVEIPACVREGCKNMLRCVDARA